jgi:hypothetical protein
LVLLDNASRMPLERNKKTFDFALLASGGIAVPPPLVPSVNTSY